MGSDDRRISYEAPPARIGRARGDAWAGAVGLGVVVLVALAVLKPWSPAPPAPVDASPATATPSPTAVPDALSVPAALHGPSVGPTALAVRAAGALRDGRVGRIGRWGVAGAGTGDGAGDPGAGTSDAATWTSWAPATPSRSTGPLDGGTACRTGPHLPPGPLALAVTAPAGIRPDWVPGLWRVLDDGPAEFPALRRLPADASARSGLSALVFTDGSPWPDGVYRIDVWAGPERATIDLCIGDGLAAVRRTSPGRPVVASGPDPLFGPLIGRLAPRSGAWGIGSAGWGTGSASGNPWSGWERVEPSVVTAGSSTRPASCPRLDRLRAGIVVAVTGPPDLAPDWTVEVARYDGHRSVQAGPAVRQVSPPGNRGVAYLVRPDSGAWPAGAYRFTVRTGSTAVVLDACLLPS